MASTRIKKLGGIYKKENFLKVLKQLDGRALLVVILINKHCDECAKIQKFIGQLENGFIDKLPQLVLLYGFSENPLDPNSPTKTPPPREEGEDKKGGRKVLGDSRILSWNDIASGHGYAIFLNQTDILYYKDTFDHDELPNNIIDNLRRFRSTIKTLAGLNAKREFLKKKRTGIIIETNGATQHSQIMELEEKVQSYGKKLSTPVYFCKGLAQEISLVKKGEVKYKMRGFNFEKFLRKLPK